MRDAMNQTDTLRIAGIARNRNGIARNRAKLKRLRTGTSIPTDACRDLRKPTRRFRCDSGDSARSRRSLAGPSSAAWQHGPLWPIMSSFVVGEALKGRDSTIWYLLVVAHGSGRYTCPIETLIAGGSSCQMYREAIK